MKSLAKMSLVVAALVLSITISAQAEWTFDQQTKTFVIEPELCRPEAFEWQWAVTDPCDPCTIIDPNIMIYDHNMFYKEISWYLGNVKPNMTSYNDPCYIGDPGHDPNAPHYGDFRLQSAVPGEDIFEVETTVWHNCHDLFQRADFYQAYSTDNGQSFINYHSMENWSEGTPPGTGYGNHNYAYSGSATIANPSDTILLRYHNKELETIDTTPDQSDLDSHVWDEWYGFAWKVWAKSAQTSFHDNYITNPFDETEKPSAIYNATQTEWLTYKSGSLANNWSANPTSCVYRVASRNAIRSIDVRLKSTDLADGDEAIFCNGTTTRLHLAIGLTPQGPWNDIYTTTQFKANSANPGAEFDLSMMLPNIIYVNIYSTDDAYPDGNGGNYYIRWGGIHIELDTMPLNCAEVRAAGLGYPGDINADCSVDMVDLSQLADDWLNCNDPQGNPADCSAPY